MRFMAILKASKDSETGVMPKAELVKPMVEFNEQMARAGVLLAAEGLQPSSRGARVRFEKGKRTVTDGPFAETQELVGGFWLLQVKSRQEAIEWIKRAPSPFGDDTVAEVEIRELFEASDFLPPEDMARLEALRAEVRRKQSR